MTIFEPKPFKSNSNLGWECPKCNRVYAPNIVMCIHCGHEKSESVFSADEGITLLLEKVSD